MWSAWFIVGQVPPFFCISAGLTRRHAERPQLDPASGIAVTAPIQTIIRKEKRIIPSPPRAAWRIAHSHWFKAKSQKPLQQSAFEAQGSPAKKHSPLPQKP